MDDDRSTVDRAIHAAQALLARTDPALTLILSERLSAPGLRNVVIRCQLIGTPDSDRTVIVKQHAIDGDSNPNDPFDPRQRWINDAAGLTFLNAIATNPRVCPRVIALDSPQRLIVLEDMQPAARIVDLLHGQDVRVAENALDALARTLGQQHASSFGRRAEYDAIRLRLATTPAASSHPWAFAFERAMPFVLRLDDVVGIKLAADLSSELDAVLDAIHNPGPFLAFIHGDPCPDNCLAGESVATLIDYELGGFGHALLDVAHARMILPTCGKPAAIPPETISVMEDTHRYWFAQASEAAGDRDHYGDALTDACAAWLIYTLAATLEQALGATTSADQTVIRKQILGRLHAFVQVSTQHQHLLATRDMTQQTFDNLAERWPDVPRAVERFAAFS